jgi:hypothetical protein
MDGIIERTCLSGPNHLQDQGDQRSRESTQPRMLGVSAQLALAHHRTHHLGVAIA